MNHPNKLSKEELNFIGELRRKVRDSKSVTFFKGCNGSMPMLIVDEATFVKLHDLLGRWPTYEMNEETGELDYNKPIILNQRYVDKALEYAGINNILVSNVPVVVATKD